MTSPDAARTIDLVDPQIEPSELLALPMRQKVVLVMDLVESVRLMAFNERAVVDHCRGFVRHATSDVLPRCRGRLVKGLGDGIMAEFDSARDATSAAIALHRYFDTVNAGLPPDQRLYLRAGLNATHVYVDDADIYGSGVNLAARVAGLAGPGEIMVTAEVRDGLTDGLDAQVEDMGECYLKHVAQPVRAFRVGAAGPAPKLLPQREYASPLQPTIAVIPFETRNVAAESFAVGHLIADGVIAQLGRTSGIKLISSLSTASFAGYPASIADIKSHLNANFVVTGNHVVVGARIVITAMLCASDSTHILWNDRFQGDLADLLEANSSLCQHIADAVHREILESSAQQALTRPMPTLASQALMLGSISLMHRSAPGDFLSSRRALDVLIERHPKAAACRAWLAKWYVLSTTRGMAQDPGRDATDALEQTRRALDAEPANSTALAIEGFVYLHLKKDLSLARTRLEAATHAGPNDALGWLFASVAAAFQGDAQEAVVASSRALALSPLDPLRYYFESLAASSSLAANDWEAAQLLCESSLRRNRMHVHTYRALITAYWFSEQPELARRTAQELMRIAPQATVSRFLQGSASAEYEFGKRMASALRGAGISE